MSVLLKEIYSFHKVRYCKKAPHDEESPVSDRFHHDNDTPVISCTVQSAAKLFVHLR